MIVGLELQKTNEFWEEYEQNLNECWVLESLTFTEQKVGIWGSFKEEIYPVNCRNRGSPLLVKW